MLRGKFTQPCAQLFVVVRSRPIAVAGTVQSQQAADAAFAHRKTCDEKPCIVASRYRLQPFFSITVFSAILSRLRSATSVFSRRFSSSSSLSRLSWLTSRPAYFDFQP